MTQLMKIYSVDGCKYCDKLKNMLDAGGYKYVDANLKIWKYKHEFEFIEKTTGNEDVPLVQMGKTILVPNKSFKTIDQCYEIICKLNVE